MSEAPTAREVSLLAVLAMLAGLTCHTSAQQPSRNRVSGRILNARDHSPLTHATVALERQQSGEVAGTVSAGDDGSFAFEAVPTGKFRLVGFAPGYVTSAYQEHEGFSTAIVTGAGIPTDNLQLELLPEAGISGRLTDENGEPLANGNIMLYREAASGTERIRRIQVKRTNDTGEYEFDNLSPGRYFLSANASPWYAVHSRIEPSGNVQYRLAVDSSLDVTYPQLFYPHGLDPDGASPIALQAGQEFTADMQMEPMHALTITILPPQGEQNGTRNAFFPQLTRTVFGVEEPVPPVIETDAHGNQILEGMAPGEYHIREVQVVGMRARGLSTSVKLTTDSIVIDRSPISHAGSLQITAHAMDGRALPQGVQLQLLTGDGPPIVGKLDAQGLVTFKDVPEGDYQIRTSAGAQNLPVLRLRMDGKTISNKHLHVPPNAESVAAEIMLASGTVNVEGSAKRDGKPADGSMLVLIPAGDDTSEELYRRSQSDLEGGFLFRNVVPGNYLLVAVDDGWSLQITDAAAMQRYLLHAVPVSVPSSTSAPMRLSEPVVTQPK